MSYSIWLRGFWLRAILGLVVGAAVGLIIYYASHLEGRNLFALAGATAGGVAAIVIHSYASKARLTSVTVTIPQLSELNFSITRDSQVAAWKLFIETATRVSIQPLQSDSGIIRESLTSLYALFQTVRQTLKASEPSRSTKGPTVEQLAITMLNVELRPFLSLWHAELTRWERQHPGGNEADWDRYEECRAALAASQVRTRQYALGFAKLAGVPQAAAEAMASGVIRNPD